MMKQRNALMSIGIALIMLIFSLVAAMVISNISSNLYKNIIVMDEGKELQYRRIVVMSLKNAADYIDNNYSFDSITSPAKINFTFSLSEALIKNSNNNLLDFPATASVAATGVQTQSGNFDFVELFTKYEKDDENYGIVVQYKQ